MIRGGLRMRFATVLLVLLTGGAFAEGVTLPPFHRFELDNGTVLLLSQRPEVPLVSVTAILRGGAVVDPADHGGLANLFASLLEKGAGDRDAAQFAEAVDSSGGTLTSRADLETITISGTFLARDAGLMVELLADMLLRPAFDESEFEKLRERSINFIRVAKDTNLNAVLPIYGQAFLFGALITPLPTASTHIHPDPTRTRKLLLHRRELDKLIGAVERKGYTLVPLALYWKRGRVKLEIALARGKQRHDKRASEKARDWQREKGRIMRGR